MIPACLDRTWPDSMGEFPGPEYLRVRWMGLGQVPETGCGHCSFTTSQYSLTSEVGEDMDLSRILKQEREELRAETKDPVLER